MCGPLKLRKNKEGQVRRLSDTRYSAKGTKGKWDSGLDGLWTLEWTWHNKLALGTRLRNLNLKSQFSIFYSFREVYGRFVGVKLFGPIDTFQLTFLF